MVWFWLWVVRLPFALGGLLLCASAAYGIFEWSVGLSGLTAGVLIADAAHHLGMRARARRRRAAKLLTFPPGFLLNDGERTRGQRAA